MNKKINKSKSNRIEDYLEKLYSREVKMDKNFKKNLDKLVDNTIRAEQIAQKEYELSSSKEKKNNKFFNLLLNKSKWQIGFLTSFVCVLLVTGVVFAAVPSLREIVIPTMGKIYINTDPEGAYMQMKQEGGIEYKFHGATPYRNELKEGKYEFILKLEGYDDYLSSFELKAGKSVNLDIILKKKKTAIDRITEWKKYTDLINGYEIIYPLNWNIITKQDEQGNTKIFEIQGDYSVIKISNNLENVINIEENPYEININNKVYKGYQDYEEWKYIVLDEFRSEDDSNIIQFVYFTKNEEEVYVYDFIKSNIKIYNIKEEEEEISRWLEYKNNSIGLSFKYPSKNWIVLENETSSTFKEYFVKDKTYTQDNFKIISSIGYFDELNDFSYDSSIQINSVEVDVYNSEGHDGKFLYIFPNRIFVIYQTTVDSDINEIYTNILYSFMVNQTQYYQDIVDYSWNLSISIPDDWMFNMMNSDEELGAGYKVFYKDEKEIKIYRWHDLQDRWDSFLEELELDNNKYFKYSQLKVDNKDVLRIEVWIFDGLNYQLIKIIYIPYSISTEENIKNYLHNPYLNIADNQFVIIVDIKELKLSNLSEAHDSIQEMLLSIDTIVNNIKGVF